jgi:hypothetical protein
LESVATKGILPAGAGLLTLPLVHSGSPCPRPEPGNKSGRRPDQESEPEEGDDCAGGEERDHDGQTGQHPDRGEPDPDPGGLGDLPYGAGQLRIFLVELSLDLSEDLLLVIIEGHLNLSTSISTH